MLDKCDSAIVESVVQGRVYAQDDKTCWMYTILATSGSCAPDVRANIHHLPWKRLWTAKGTEVLRLGSRSRRNYCYAVRTEITDEDLRQTLKRARAFLNPVPPPVRRTLPVATLLTLLGVAVLLTGGARSASAQTGATSAEVPGNEISIARGRQNRRAAFLEHAARTATGGPREARIAHPRGGRAGLAAVRRRVRGSAR
jgi:hypothetical protein